VIDYATLEHLKAEILKHDLGVSDGPVCVERYSVAVRRIVWVLREPHTDEGRWDLGDFLCNKLLGCRGWHCTYGLVAKVSRALLQRSIPNVLPVTSAKEAADSIRDVAVVNVKKTGGSRRVHRRTLREGAEVFRSILERQLAALDPEIVIAAGTFDLVPCLVATAAGTLRSASRTQIIRTYHPGQTRLTHQVLYSSILEDLVSNGYLLSDQT
jgi:hypothetical protein